MDTTPRLAAQIVAWASLTQDARRCVTGLELDARRELPEQTGRELERRSQLSRVAPGQA